METVPKKSQNPSKKESKKKYVPRASSDESEQKSEKTSLNDSRVESNNDSIE